MMDGHEDTMDYAGRLAEMERELVRERELRSAAERRAKSFEERLSEKIRGNDELDEGSNIVFLLFEGIARYGDQALDEWDPELRKTYAKLSDFIAPLAKSEEDAPTLPTALWDILCAVFAGYPDWLARDHVTAVERYTAANVLRRSVIRGGELRRLSE